MMILVVNFHYVGEGRYPYPGIYPVTPTAFERQLDELGKSFTFVSLSEIDEAVAGRRTLPKRSCLVTFDDGLREQYDLAWPILRRRGIPAVFFVNTAQHVTGRAATVHKVHWLRAHTPPEKFFQDVEDVCRKSSIVPVGAAPTDEVLAAQYRYDLPQVRRLKHLLNFQLSSDQAEVVIESLFAERWDEMAFVEERYMGPSQWCDLAEADCLGLHSHTHRPLAELSSDEAMKDLAVGMETLTAAVGVTPFAVSYPYGGPSAVNRKVAATAASLGLRVGFTMERAMNRNLDDPLLLARADTNDAPGGKRPCVEVRGSGAGATVVCHNGFAERRSRYAGVHV